MATNISSIGSGVGRDYPTIEAWRVATAGSSDIERGQLYADSTFNESVNFDDSGTTAGAYRQLEPAPGETVLWENTGNPCKIKEDFFRLRGKGRLEIRNTYTGSGNRYCVNITDSALNAVVSGVKGSFTGVPTGTDSAVFNFDTGTSGAIISCIARVSVGGNGRFGFRNASTSGVKFLVNCVAHGFDDFANSSGVQSVNTSSLFIYNTISVGSAIGDDFAVGGAVNVDYCISEDSSAGGASSITGAVIGDLFQDTTDYRPKADADSVDAGVSLSGLLGALWVTYDDQTFDPDGSGVEIGPWNGPLALSPAPVDAEGEVPAQVVVRELVPGPVPGEGEVPAPALSFTLTPAPVAAEGDVPDQVLVRELVPGLVAGEGEVPAHVVELVLVPLPVAGEGEVPDPLVGVRVETGLVALWPFDDQVGSGAGTSVRDVIDPPLPLLAGTGLFEWTAPGLRFTGVNVLLASAPLKVTTAPKATDEVTMEAWIDPTDPDVEGRFMSIDGGNAGLNVALVQNFERGAAHDFGGAIRTSGTGIFGTSFNGSNGVSTGGLQHVVLTRGPGYLRMFVDGELYISIPALAGDFSTWDESGAFYMLLGAAANLTQTWIGTYRLAAVYDRALSPPEVAQNFLAGPDTFYPKVLTPAPVAAEGVLPAPVVSIALEVVEPDPVTGAGQVLGVAEISRTLVPEPAAGAGEVPAVQVLTDLVLTPDPVAAEGLVPAAFANVGLVLSPAPTAAVGEVEVPSLDFPRDLSPAPVQGAGAVPPVDLSIEIRILPGLVRGEGRLPAPALDLPLVALPAPVAAEGLLPNPELLVSGLLKPLPVAAEGFLPEGLVLGAYGPALYFELPIARVLATDLELLLVIDQALVLDRVLVTDLLCRIAWSPDQEALVSQTFTSDP